MEKINEVLSESGWDMVYSVVDAGGYEKPSKFTVTISKNGVSHSTEYTKGWGLRHYKTTQRKATWKVAEFHGRATIQNVADFNRRTTFDPPTLEEVIYCLFSDAQCVMNGESFEDFAAEFGYDEDSRKAEKVYHECVKTWQALLRMGADFEELGELFQDY